MCVSNCPEPVTPTPNNIIKNMKGATKRARERIPKVSVNQVMFTAYRQHRFNTVSSQFCVYQL